jgi:hypothetical protein
MIDLNALSAVQIATKAREHGLSATIIGLAHEEITALRAEVSALRADNDRLRTYAIEATKALTGLTVGGSEFFKGDKRLGFFEANITASVKNVEWRLDNARKFGEARARAAYDAALKQARADGYAQGIADAVEVAANMKAKDMPELTDAGREYCAGVSDVNAALAALGGNTNG